MLTLALLVEIHLLASVFVFWSTNIRNSIIGEVNSCGQLQWFVFLWGNLRARAGLMETQIRS